jgi:hypothetical protein
MMMMLWEAAGYYSCVAAAEGAHVVKRRTKTHKNNKLLSMAMVC